MPTLYIVTGPPGSGKTTYSTQQDLPVFDHDLENKHDWQQCPTDCILNTAAPSRENKEYWRAKAISHGFQPVVLVMWVPRMVALQRMQQRSGRVKTQRNNLSKGVERWYREYSPHREERRVHSS